MPKSKIRSRYQKSHYNKNAGVLVGRSKQARWGKKAKPVPGSSHRITKMSPYMGTRLTPENLGEYKKQQSEAFKDKFLADVVRKREEIENQEDKSEEEIAKEINEYNSQQPSERGLELLSQRFAKFQAGKEKKHYEAWLKGKSSFTYKSKNFPVLTQRFLEQTQSIKEIIPVNESIESGSEVEGSGNTPEVSGNSKGGDNETLRSDDNT